MLTLIETDTRGDRSGRMRRGSDCSHRTANRGVRGRRVGSTGAGAMTRMQSYSCMLNRLNF